MMKEEYKAISLVLEKINYHEHQWVICVDLKMVNFLLGQQSGYTKYPCFLWLWESRAKHEQWARILCGIVVADPTLGSLTKGASCVSDDWKACIINLCFCCEINRFSCSELFFSFLICFLHN
jgi:hypothetical protein